MKIIGLDNNIYNWYPVRATIVQNNSSSYHIIALNLIKELFPVDMILEEVILPGSKTAINDNLRLDFYLPNQKIGIEVHGEQHYKYVPFFHLSKKDFLLSQRRDANKQKWCEQNNITYLVLPYNQQDKWKEILWQRKN